MSTFGKIKRAWQKLPTQAKVGMGLSALFMLGSVLTDKLPVREREEGEEPSPSPLPLPLPKKGEIPMKVGGRDIFLTQPKRKRKP